MAAANYSRESIDDFISRSMGSPVASAATQDTATTPPATSEIIGLQNKSEMHKGNIVSIRSEIEKNRNNPNALKTLNEELAKEQNNLSGAQTSELDNFISSSIKKSQAPASQKLAEEIDRLQPSQFVNIVAPPKPEEKQLTEAQTGATVNPMMARQGAKIRQRVQDTGWTTQVLSVGDIAKKILQPTAALADIAIGAVPATIGQVAYNVARPFTTPENAQQIQRKISEPYQNLTGRLANIEHEPGYTGEAATRIMGFVGENVGKGAQWISDKTGAPVQDVESMIQTLSLAAPGAIKAGSKVAVQAGKGAVEFARDVATTRQQLADQFAQKKAPAAAPEVAPAAGMQSGGAAATQLESSIKTALADATPEIQEKFKNVPASQYTPETLSAIENHNQFAKFGITPTEGEALQNTGLMSRETNDRLKDPALQARLEERDPKLVEGFNSIKQNIAPDVYETDPVRLANMPLEKMKADMVAHEQRIREAYDKANNATGTGQSAIDVEGLKNNIDAELKKKGKTKYLPSELRGDLEDALKKGYLTAEEYENFRTDTATIARTNQNPLARQAASIVRTQLENVPLKGEFAKYKPLYDEARALVVDLKNKEKIPAYKAAASDTRTAAEIELGIPHPAANTFLERHYGEKTPEVNIQRMLDIIGRDTPEHQALNAAKVDQFKLRSGIKNNEGKVSQAALNKIIFETHKSNLPVMFGNAAAKSLQDLAEVARKTEHVKGVHGVNVSNTELVREQNAAVKAAKEIGGTLGEIALAKATGGASVVAVPAIKGMFKARQEKALAAKEATEKAAESERRLSRTAGIRLKDIGKKD